jgi:hypothetical protein
MASEHPDVVARRAVAEARRLRATRREIRANIAAGLVESRLQHRKYRRVGSGDRDSVGYLQQRPSMGWGPAGESIEKDTRDFIQRAKQYRGQKMTAGQLAQAVQRSAFPERYQQELGTAKKIIRRVSGGSGGGQGGRMVRGPGGSFNLQGPQHTDVILGQKTIPGQSFAAERDAARKQLLLSGDFSLDNLLKYKSSINSLKDVPDRTVAGDITVRRTQGKGMTVKTKGDQVWVRGAGGKLVARPNANMQGRKWGGSAYAGKALVKAAGLPVSSRKRDTVNTASGGVSDHYRGNKDSYAWDLSVTGAKGTATARKLARMLGKNWQGGSWLEVIKEIGGVKYRFQLGWNVPDHYDHIHMGVDRVDTPG